MKKRNLKKLSLNRETVVKLGTGPLAQVRGERAAGTADFETCEGCDSYYERCLPAEPKKDVLAFA